MQQQLQQAYLEFSNERFRQSQTNITSKETATGGGLNPAVKRAKPNTEDPKYQLNQKLKKCHTDLSKVIRVGGSLKHSEDKHKGDKERRTIKVNFKNTATKKKKLKILDNLSKLEEIVDISKSLPFTFQMGKSD